MRLLLVLLMLAAALPVPAPAAEPLEPGYWERSALPTQGLATYYADGVMDWVWQYRRAHGQVPECSECVGAVALLRAGDIGRKVWLEPPTGEMVGPFLVVDCAQEDHAGDLLARGWSVDVDFRLGELWGMTGPLAGVTVWADPSDDSVTEPFRPAVAAYIDPAQVHITAPTPDPGPSEVPTAWPTRQPQPIATPAAAPSAASAGAEVGHSPVITQPTPTPSASAAVPSGAVEGRANATPDPVGATQSGRQTPAANRVSIGDAGSMLLTSVAAPGVVPLRPRYGTAGADQPPETPGATPAPTADRVAGDSINPYQMVLSALRRLLR